jgi:hemolysin activation/secretion protein
MPFHIRKPERPVLGKSGRRPNPARSFLSSPRYWLAFAWAPALLSASALAADTNNPPAAASPPKKRQTFEVRDYRIEGDTILPQDKIDGILHRYLGKEMDIDQILKGVGELQLLYRDLGFATVAVALPRQQISNGVVRVRVTAGRLAKIAISGTRHFSSNNIARALPGLRTNALLNTRWFQPELDRANANPDRQIYPVIGPGTEPGTSDLTLNVKDRLPLHGHIEINNIATPDTPPLRIDSSIQYNNLWQLDQQAGLEYNFSPQAFKTENQLPRFYDQPQIASGSAFYRIPLGSAENLQETYDRLPADFGYDPISHTFRQPPSSGAPDFTFYGSRSSSETPVRYGPITLVTEDVRANITSQPAEQDFIVNGSLGGRFNQPLPAFAGVKSAFTAGLETKNFQMRSYSTNLTYFKLYSLDADGNPVLESSKTVPLGSYSRVNLNYFPLALGWSGLRPDSSGNVSLSLSQISFFSAVSSDRSGFIAATGSPEAGGNYTTVSGSVTRDQVLPGGWSASLRASALWASSPLISNEEFALGGAAGPRGYEDGETYGDRGWLTQFDLRAPPANLGRLPGPGGGLPVRLRSSVFMDYGQTWRIDQPPGTAGEDQWGTGFGFFATAGERLDARFTLAWALLDTERTRAGGARAYFRVGWQF